MSTLRKVMRKLYSGDSLTDEELKETLPTLKHLESLLRDMGPEFKLAANEILRHVYNMESWKEARVRHAKENHVSA